MSTQNLNQKSFPKRDLKKFVVNCQHGIEQTSQHLDKFEELAKVVEKKRSLYLYLVSYDEKVTEMLVEWTFNLRRMFLEKAFKYIEEAQDEELAGLYRLSSKISDNEKFQENMFSLDFTATNTKIVANTIKKIFRDAPIFVSPEIKEHFSLFFQNHYGKRYAVNSLKKGLNKNSVSEIILFIDSLNHENDKKTLKQIALTKDLLFTYFNSETELIKLEHENEERDIIISSLEEQQNGFELITKSELLNSYELGAFEKTKKDKQYHLALEKEKRRYLEKKISNAKDFLNKYWAKKFRLIFPNEFKLKPILKAAIDAVRNPLHKNLLISFGYYLSNESLNVDKDSISLLLQKQNLEKIAELLVDVQRTTEETDQDPKELILYEINKIRVRYHDEIVSDAFRVFEHYPDHKRKMFKGVIRHLWRVSKRSEKMNPRNLAIVCAPSLFPEMIQKIDPLVDFVELLINHYEHHESIFNKFMVREDDD